MIRSGFLPATPVLLCLLLTGSVMPAGAATTVACHCFQERQFDPARPAAADPYLLATVQNRLIAHLFAVPRQEIVRSKMGGLAGDRLWVAGWVALAAGRPLADGLAAIEAAGSWPAAAARLGADPERLGAEFTARLANGADEAALAAASIDQAAVRWLGTAPAALAELHGAGAAGQDLVAALLLAGATGRQPAEVYRQVRRGGSWGGWMQQAGLSTEQLEAWLARTLGAAEKR